MTESFLYATLQTISRIGTTLLFDLKVKGVSNVPRTGGVLIVANHQSYLDPVLVGVRLPRGTSFLAKSELFESGFSRWLLPRLGAFPVRQGEGDIGAVREAIARLKEGRALVLFPEGSRTENGELEKVQPGVGLIARKAGVPVVPCLIHGSFTSWPRQRKMFKPTPIHVHFGESMRLGHLRSSEIVKEIDTTFHRMFNNLRNEMRQETDGHATGAH
jgi:1-acyl-sn-glycerol-3-phosphate acyltransferase